MPFAQSKGAKLYYEEAGSGHPVIFVHEFAGDYRSWEQQIRFFSRRYRCIVYNARGYPPSEVPADGRMYSQDIATDDILAVLDHLEIPKAHVVGLSMGGFATLHFGLRHAARASCLVVAGCGYGAPKVDRERFREEVLATAGRFEKLGTRAVTEGYGVGPTRVQHQNKDMRGWVEFNAQLAEHSNIGSALTMRGVQAKRPSVYDLEAKLKKLTVPTLIVTGDEDEPCLDASLWMKRTIPSAGLWMAPKTGHNINLEEAEAFNAQLADFFAQVENGRWDLRDPRSLSKNILSLEEKPAKAKAKAKAKAG